MTDLATLGISKSEHCSFDRLRRLLAARETSPLQDYQRGVWIHGAGGFGRMLAKALSHTDVTVLGFIDRLGVDLATVDGFRVVHPDAMTNDDVASAFHLSGVLNHLTSSRENARWAEDRGFAGLLFPTDLFAVPGLRLRHYWLAPPAETIANLDAIEAVHDALDDEESRLLLQSLVLYRMTADPRRQPVADLAQAYAPRFLPIFERPITFIDGGAYTGDTLDALLGHGIAVGDWVAFEPDAKNFLRLRETAKRRRAQVGAHTLLQLGLSDCNARIAFSDGEGAASHVAGPGDANASFHIDAVRLDDVIDRTRNVYIKLDIEGAEMQALLGMSRHLDRNPVLAVSIYHKPADLWEIPLYLKQRLPSFRLRMRQHGHHGFDTVLYVYPK